MVAVAISHRPTWRPKEGATATTTLVAVAVGVAVVAAALAVAPRVDMAVDAF
jgi:hypothetical protein